MPTVSKNLSLSTAILKATMQIRMEVIFTLSTQPYQLKSTQHKYRILNPLTQ